ncbi:hypothetical protein [Methylobacterium sp. sgz302542]|uniref:hypothetical protein n=1 Tax=Methylobacterium sp. sgz302542 TaxID=3418176 RepID=UPI003EBA7099
MAGPDLDDRRAHEFVVESRQNFEFVRRERTQDDLLNVSVSRISPGLSATPELPLMREPMIERAMLIRTVGCDTAPDLFQGLDRLGRASRLRSG